MRYPYGRGTEWGIFMVVLQLGPGLQNVDASLNI